jgi:NhaA family Na+:H+ antiporter
MTVFFYVVGLEIKREVLVGELRSMRKAIVPVIAALGGVVAPIALFMLFSQLLMLSPDASRGWAVPMATDIAFVMGVLTLFGKRLPVGLKLLMLSLAIVDDLAAIIVIATAFTDQIGWGALAWSAAGFSSIYFLATFGCRKLIAYLILAGISWYGVFSAGIHPTIAGVILGFLTSHQTDREGAEHQEVSSPLVRAEHTLHPWVAFGIMPLFAFANAGVTFDAAAFADPVATAIALSLLIGKPLGIMLFTAVGVWCGIAQLPKGVTWLMMLGASTLGGIGFTMAIFLATLSLPLSALAAGKCGILFGSFASAVIGSSILWWSVRRKSV